MHYVDLAAGIYKIWSELLILFMTIVAAEVVMAIKTHISFFWNRTGYQMQKTRSKIASRALFTLLSSIRRWPRMSLVFWVIFPRLETVPYVVSFLLTIIASDLAQLSADPNRKARHINNGNWDGNKASLSLITAMFLFFLLSSFSVGAILKP